MASKIKINGRLIAAARALIGVNQADFAAAAGLPTETLLLMERGSSAWLNSEHEISAVSRALERFGIVVIGESDGMGPGVRLKLNPESDCHNSISRPTGVSGIRLLGLYLYCLLLATLAAGLAAIFATAPHWLPELIP
jgi:hypothetical protein